MITEFTNMIVLLDLQDSLKPTIKLNCSNISYPYNL